MRPARRDEIKRRIADNHHEYGRRLGAARELVGVGSHTKGVAAAPGSVEAQHLLAGGFMRGINADRLAWMLLVDAEPEGFGGHAVSDAAAAQLTGATLTGVRYGLRSVRRYFADRPQTHATLLRLVNDYRRKIGLSELKSLEETGLRLASAWVMPIRPSRAKTAGPIKADQGPGLVLVKGEGAGDGGGGNTDDHDGPVVFDLSVADGRMLAHAPVHREATRTAGTGVACATSAVYEALPPEARGPIDGPERITMDREGRFYAGKSPIPDHVARASLAWFAIEWLARGENFDGLSVIRDLNMASPRGRTAMQIAHDLWIEAAVDLNVPEGSRAPGVRADGPRGSTQHLTQTCTSAVEAVAELARLVDQTQREWRAQRAQRRVRAGWR